jgi:hypothetical protein
MYTQEGQENSQPAMEITTVNGNIEIAQGTLSDTVWLS